MNPEYTVEYFIKKFEAIPEDQWCTGDFTDGQGRCCAYGHCGVRKTACLVSSTGTQEGDALERILGFWVAVINDGDDSSFPQETPKQRILAALREKL